MVFSCVMGSVGKSVFGNQSQIIAAAASWIFTTLLLIFFPESPLECNVDLVNWTFNLTMKEQNKYTCSLNNHYH